MILPGHRALIEEEDFSGTLCQHFSGVGLVTEAVTLRCPNCEEVLFPAMNLSLTDSLLKPLAVWQRSYLHVLFCPSCFLWMKPYWIHHTESGINVLGGERDGGERVHQIVTPYKARIIELKSLDANGLDTDVPPHQIGGERPMTELASLNCPICNGLMQFFGVLAYDDLNVPLYENGGSPVALIIGDYDTMHIEICQHCSCVGLQWVY